MTKEPSFTIIPLDCVGPIKLGMTRLEVRDILVSYVSAELDQSGRLDYAFGNSLQIEYDLDGFVQFIGVGWYNECGCDYLLGDTHVGDLPAEKMFATLAKLDGTEGLIYILTHSCFHVLLRQSGKQIPNTTVVAMRHDRSTVRLELRHPHTYVTYARLLRPHHDRKLNHAVQSNGILHRFAGTFASFHGGTDDRRALCDGDLPVACAADFYLARALLALVFHLGWTLLGALVLSRESQLDI